jgi:hypothetical protein
VEESVVIKKRCAWFASAVIAGSLSLLSVGAADGAAFRVGFDPQFEASGTLANLGFEGTGDLTIDDGCFNSTGEFVPGTGSCGSAFFTSLTLQLYDVADGPGTILETLTYAPPNQAVGGVVSHVIVDPPGDLVGIDTLFFGPLLASAIDGTTGPPPLPEDSHISIEFLANFHAVPFSVNPNVVLNICDTTDDNCTLSTGQATVTFTRLAEAVPEPASTLLALTALGALGWVQRRRGRRGRG